MQGVSLGWRTAVGGTLEDISAATQFAPMNQSNSTEGRTRRGGWRGVRIGLLFTGPAILVAIMSAGAGHGSYVTARVLFPYAMLVSQFEGSIGPTAMGIGLLQFPLYGALIGRAVAKQTTRSFLVTTAHLVATLACFSGPVSQFT